LRGDKTKKKERHRTNRDKKGANIVKSYRRFGRIFLSESSGQRKLYLCPFCPLFYGEIVGWVV